MPFLFLAVLGGAVKGYCGKKISGYAKNVADCALMHTVRLLFCTVIGTIVLVFIRPDFRIPSMAEICIITLSGITTAVFLISWTLAVRSDAYMLVSACTTASFLIPMLFGFFLFSERPGMRCIFGIVAIFIAVVFFVLYNNRIKAKLDFPRLFLLFLIFLSQGFINFTQKMFTYYVEDGSKEVFQLGTFLIALICLCIWQSIHRILHRSERSDLPIKKLSLPILIMAVALFVNSYCLTLATEYVPSVILFPLNSVLSLAASTIMSAVFFRERITKLSAAGLIFTLAALLLVK